MLSLPSFYFYLIAGLWIAWMLIWAVSATAVKAVERRESPLSKAAHTAPLWIVVWFLWARTLPGGFLDGRFVPDKTPELTIGAALVAAGIAVTVWARVHLGANWSGTVTVKRDHELIRSGPYRFVRHPIYSGLLLALLGTAIAVGEWRGLVAVLIAFATFWGKLRLEERWMVETFGRDYRDYQAKVAALVPRVL